MIKNFLNIVSSRSNKGITKLPGEVTSELVSKLNRINTIDNINNGGCAIVAYGIVEWLKHNNQKASVVYLFDDTDDLHSITNGGNGSCTHAVVKFNRAFYDSHRVYADKKELKKYWDFTVKKKLTQDTILKSIQYKYHWAHWFDRKSGVQKINSILNLDIPIKE